MAKKMTPAATARKPAQSVEKPAEISVAPEKEAAAQRLIPTVRAKPAASPRKLNGSGKAAGKLVPAEVATAKPAAAKASPSKPAPGRSKAVKGRAPLPAKTSPAIGAPPSAVPEAATALDLPPAPLDAATQAYFDKCIEKIGYVPNVLLAYAFDLPKLTAFAAMYNDLMLAPSGLSKLEREMIAVAVSAVNRCYYCLTAHGAAVRALSGNPQLGEQIVMNYRAARLDPRQRTILDFAVKLTETPHGVEEGDRAALRTVGLSDRDIWDVAAVTGFFNMSNRVATATDMRPNPEYHLQSRGSAD